MTPETPKFTYRGALVGHGDWVTSIATSASQSDLLVSASRDKSLIVWNLSEQSHDTVGRAQRRLVGHDHIVQDVAISSDARYAMSASWDKNLRLWDLSTGKSLKIFRGHTKAVTSVTFSPDNRQIVSGSHDLTIRVWNTLGECKMVIDSNSHTQWVNCVRFSPSINPLLISAGSDRLVNVWNLADTNKPKYTFKGDSIEVRSVTVSPDATLCASGGKEGINKLWDLNSGDELYHLDAGHAINALVFSPTKYWMCAATDYSIKVWDLETKEVVDEIRPDVGSLKMPICHALAWSHDGNMLYGAFSDNQVRAWQVTGM